MRYVMSREPVSQALNPVDLRLTASEWPASDTRRDKDRHPRRAHVPIRPRRSCAAIRGMAVAQASRVHRRRSATPPALAHYIRHRPEDTVLYGVVEEHLESFYRAALGEQGASLPAFVHAEFERYLRCGRLAHG